MLESGYIPHGGDPVSRVCSEQINIRVTPEEKRLLAKKAAAVGLSVSGFLLFEALGEELGQVILDVRDRNKKRKD